MIIKKNKIKQWEDKCIERIQNNESDNVVPDTETTSDTDVTVTSYSDTDTDTDTETETDKSESITNQPELPPEPDIDLFNIENIDFNQRQERRRGTRRRGYRRIDDRNLVSRAQDEAANIKRSAFEEGYQAGLQKAMSDINIFKENIKNFMTAPKEVFEYIAPDILEISVNIAQKIIQQELKSNPQVLLDIILDVLRNVCKNEVKITIKVNPQIASFVKESLPSVTYEYGIDTQINIIADPSISEGGCIFQTNNGIVDASIDTQIEIIKKALEGI